MARLTIRRVRPSDWKAVEQLFGSNGACGGCWCMFWRVPTRRDFEAVKGERAHAALRRLVRSGRHRALLAFEGNEAVGWCNLGPRAGFPLTERSRAYRIDDPEGVWSANCFFVRRDRRGQGVAEALLRAAVAAARAGKARVLEGYPYAPSKPLPGAFMYRGALSMFERQGFRVVSRRYRASPLVRRAFGSGR